MSTKPLPRKTRVENRGYQYSKSKDRSKNISVSLKDIDSAIFYYFDESVSYFSILTTKTSLIQFSLTVLLDDLSALESFLPPLKSFV